MIDIVKKRVIDWDNQLRKENISMKSSELICHQAL